MPTNTWIAEHEGLNIRVVNRWSYYGNCTEQLFVNDELISEIDKNALSGTSFKDYVAGELKTTVNQNGRDYHIEAKLGNKWHMCSVGCHIFVNGDLVGGDTKTKLFFVG